MEQPLEVRQALKTITAYIARLEHGLETERAARHRAELKLKAARGTSPPQKAPPPPAGTREAALQILGLEGKPSEQEIRKAFRDRARQSHPDVVGGSAEEFQQFKNAMEVLLR